MRHSQDGMNNLSSEKGDDKKPTRADHHSFFVVILSKMKLLNCSMDPEYLLVSLSRDISNDDGLNSQIILSSYCQRKRERNT